MAVGGCATTKFQSTFPRGERRYCSSVRSRHGAISIHVPAWGTTEHTYSSFLCDCISIHVPAWGTTTPMIIYRPSQDISIHVPAWGTTEDWEEAPEHWDDFNPRSRVGNDAKAAKSVTTPAISIHVPAWGTTIGIIQHHMEQGISIHVPAWGTTYSMRYNKRYRKFQSTFPRGERREKSQICLKTLRFQSTFPRGERHVNNYDDSSITAISIHVPAWGTTFYDSYQIFHSAISIHVPAWGTTRGSNENANKLINFNPRSRVGNDACWS